MNSLLKTQLFNQTGPDGRIVMSPEVIKRIIIGHIATEMGLADQSKVVKSGNEVFGFISSLTYKEFREIKKEYRKQLTAPTGKEDKPCE